MPYSCSSDNRLLADGTTPMICTPSSDPWVFYFAAGLNKTCPSCDFADRIREHASKHPPPYFITTCANAAALSFVCSCVALLTQ